MQITYNAAWQHLEGVAKLSIEENRYLSCVHTYLRSAELDVVGVVRADTVKHYDDLRKLIELQRRVSDQVDRFLRGDL